MLELVGTLFSILGTTRQVFMSKQEIERLTSSLLEQDLPTPDQGDWGGQSTLEGMSGQELLDAFYQLPEIEPIYRELPTTVLLEAIFATVEPGIARQANKGAPSLIDLVLRAHTGLANLLLRGVEIDSSTNEAWRKKLIGAILASRKIEREEQ